MSRSVSFLLFLTAGAQLAGCGGDGGTELPPEVDCASVTVPTYEEVTIWPQCVNCHASTLTGAYRRGAPLGIDYDTYESAKLFAQLGATEVNVGSMPFTGTVTEEQKQSFYAWAMCGTP
jgi:uncharacterized membrane protein